MRIQSLLGLHVGKSEKSPSTYLLRSCLITMSVDRSDRDGAQTPLQDPPSDDPERSGYSPASLEDRVVEVVAPVMFRVFQEAMAPLQTMLASLPAALHAPTSPNEQSTSEPTTSQQPAHTGVTSLSPGANLGKKQCV